MPTEPTVLADALIVATGARSLMLGCPNEARLLGYGVSTCATCDGFFFREHHIAVAGGGDSALEEALFLTRFATKVTVIHRRDELRASKIMQDRAFKPTRRSSFCGTQSSSIYGATPKSACVQAVQDTAFTGATSGAAADRAFSSPSATSPTAPCSRAANSSSQDNGWRVRTLRKVFPRTSVDGVFACGDVQDHYYRQAITSAGSGCIAAIDAEHWLEERGE